MKFRYIVYNEDRTLISGKLDAESEEGALNILNYGGYYPVSIKRDIPFFNQEKLLSGFYRIDVREIIRFTRQLALLLESGADILGSLHLLQQQITSKTLRKVIGRVVSDIRAGNSLSTALMKHPKAFSEIYCKTIAAGEQGGTLEIALRNVAGYMERTVNAQKKLKNALTYPFIVAVVAIIVVFVLLYFVFPAFGGLYTALKTEPPLSMRIMMGTSTWLNQYWHYLMSGVFTVMIIAFATIRTKTGKYQWHRLLLKLPVIGRIVILQELSRCCQVMSLLFKVGLPAPEILHLAISGTTNMVVAEALTGVQEELMGGSGLSKPMASRRLFLPMMVQMVSAGEETGNLDDTLSTTAESFAIECEDRTNSAIELVQPAMTVGIGILVAFIAVSLVSAMYSIYGQLG